jgi:hypothetical protein
VTNDQKNDLRWCVKNHPEWSDKRMADYAECAISTVRKYRAALTERTKAPEQKGGDSHE